MFKTENRYMTRKVAEEIPLEINILLWNLIDELNVEKDYLQIFELNPIGEGIVEIIHKQEVPEYKSSLYIHSEEIKENKKLYAIDSLEYSTLMLSEEY